MAKGRKKTSNWTRCWFWLQRLDASAMQARMVANKQGNKRKLDKKKAQPKGPGMLRRTASRVLPATMVRKMTEEGEVGESGFTPSGLVVDVELQSTAQPWRAYLRFLVRPCQQIERSTLFNAIVYSAIAVAVVLVGLDTYVEEDSIKFVQTCDCFLLEQPGWRSVQRAVVILDQVVLVIFAIEIGVKVVAYKYRPLLFFFGPEWRWNNFDFVVVVACSPLFDVEGAAMLRLMRLARLLKVFKKVVQLQVILKGLVRGLASVFYVALLLLLIMYFYAIMGITYFRDNDPFHFGNLGLAMTTLFRAATLEDWTDLMYGCDKYPASPARRWPCDLAKAEGLYAFGFFYWVSYVLLASLVTLSLFIGAITLGMTESMEEVLEEKKAAEALASAEAKRKLQERMSQSGKQAEVLALWKGIAETDEARGGAEAHAWQSRPAVRAYLELSRRCRHVSHQAWFSHLVTAAILFAGVLAGIETAPAVLEASPDTFYALNLIIAIIFTIEVAVKILAEGLKPWHFLRSTWNLFDLVVVVCTWLPTDGGSDDGGEGEAAGEDDAGAPSPLKVIRLLRLMRVLKLVRALPQLQIIVQALFAGLSSIAYIVMLLLLLFYVFAIFGIMMYRKNDPLHWQTLDVAMITLFRMSTMEDWTDVMYIAMYGCVDYGYDDGTQWVRGMCDNATMRTESSEGPPEGGLGVIFFFVPFILLSALVLMSLFIGVITTSMESAAEMQKHEKEQAIRLGELQLEYSARQQVSNERIFEYKQIFSFFDADGGGSIDRDEFRVAMRCIDEAMSNEQVEEWLHMADENQDDAIQFVEFAKVAMQMEFDRDALEQKRQALAQQRAHVKSVLARLDAEGLPPHAHLRGEGLRRVLQSFLELQRLADAEATRAAAAALAPGGGALGPLSVAEPPPEAAAAAAGAGAGAGRRSSAARSSADAAEKERASVRGSVRGSGGGAANGGGDAPAEMVLAFPSMVLRVLREVESQLGFSLSEEESAPEGAAADEGVGSRLRAGANIVRTAIGATACSTKSMLGGRTAAAATEGAAPSEAAPRRSSHWDKLRRTSASAAKLRRSHSESEELREERRGSAAHPSELKDGPGRHQPGRASALAAAPAPAPATASPAPSAAPPPARGLTPAEASVLGGAGGAGVVVEVAGVVVEEVEMALDEPSKDSTATTGQVAGVVGGVLAVHEAGKRLRRSSSRSGMQLSRAVPLDLEA